MMRQILAISTLFLTLVSCSASKKAGGSIDRSLVDRVLNTLAADDMEGRKPATPGIEKAAAFLEQEFKKAGLQPLPSAQGFRQEFMIYKAENLSAVADWDGAKLDLSRIIAYTTKQDLHWKTGDAEVIKPAAGDRGAIFAAFDRPGNTLLVLDSSNAAMFKRLKNFKMSKMDGGGELVVVQADMVPGSYDLQVTSQLKSDKLTNIAGMIPGRSRKAEHVIFSSHYDHLGYGKAVNGDSLYNGANDDASGTTAVVALANHFSKARDNERTIIFVAFTAEESGGFGSQYFSKHQDPASVVAMFNIEMIGTDSKWGKNSAYITGYERSDFGAILQADLEGSGFTFHPDPYPDQNLFFRSDNATLARQGVPAHTISTSKMDSEKYYHTVDDEVGTLDTGNMTEIIKSIAISSKGIISGKKTPTRVVLKPGE